jgi:hypothetical protein
LLLATVNYYVNVVQYLVKLQRSSVFTSVPIISTVTEGSTRFNASHHVYSTPAAVQLALAPHKFVGRHETGVD